MNKLVSVMLIAFAASSAAGNDTTAFKGTLCFVPQKQASDCRFVTGKRISVAAGDVERMFVWSNADGKQLVFGVLPPKGETIDLTDKALRDLTLTIRGDRRHGWPEDLQIHATDANKKKWTWSVPAKTAESLAQLRFPSGKYTIVFSADHHLTEKRQIGLSKNTALGQVILRPMPMIAGRVMTMKDQPIANAQLARDDGKVIATTNEQGNFRAEAGEPLPDSVLLEKSGFGSLQIPVQFAEGDADLGAIRLSSGIKLSLHIERPQGNHDVLHVALKHQIKTKYLDTPIASRELAADQDKLVFEDLSEGEYGVVIEGKTPLEKLTTDVKIDDADEQKDIKIEPYRLNGRATIGEDPINGDLGISTGRLDANFKLPIQDGQFSATLWQHGRLDGWVQPKGLGSFQVVTSPELGADPSEWDIRFPKRLISGRIYDADTQQPLGGAQLVLLRSSSDSRWYGPIHVQEDGTFEILAVKTGTYDLTVTAPDYEDMKQTVEVGDDDGSVNRDFPLARGELAVLQAEWPSGMPVANATVLDGVAADGILPERQYTLDGSGKLSLRLQQDEVRTLYIVPREGSFAIAHLAARDRSDSNPTLVTVPEPTGSLQIQILTSDGKPASSAKVAMRFDGEPIPEPVLDEIGNRSMNARLLLQLPAGAYELWPISEPMTWAASSRSQTQIGEVKRIDLSAGAINVELVTNQ